MDNILDMTDTVVIRINKVSLVLMNIYIYITLKIN